MASSTGWTYYGAGNDISFTGGYLRVLDAQDTSAGQQAYMKPITTVSNTSWSLDFDCRITSGSGNGQPTYFGLWSDADQTTATGDSITARCATNGVSGNAYISMDSHNDGTNVEGNVYCSGISQNTWYYLTLSRTSPTGASLACYSDTGRSSLIDTISMTISSDVIDLDNLGVKASVHSTYNGEVRLDNPNLELTTIIPPPTSTTGTIGTALQNPNLTYINSNLPDNTDTLSLGGFVKLDMVVPTITVEEDFSTDTWSKAKPSIAVVSGGIMTFTAQAGLTNSNGATTYDVGIANISDTEWVLRYSYQVPSGGYNPSTATEHATIGLSSEDSSVHGRTNQEGLFHRVYQKVGHNQYLVSSDENKNPEGTGGEFNTGFTNPDEETTARLYWEMKRVSAIQGSLQQYTDSSYGTTTGNLITVTMNTGQDNFRYIKILNDMNSGSGSVVYDFDDIKFYNGVTSAEPIPPTNTKLLKLNDVEFSVGTTTASVGVVGDTITLEDDFASDTWTGAGNSGTPTTVTISGGDLSAVNVAVAGDDRMYKAIGTTLSDTVWVLQFETNVSSSGSGQVILAGFVDGTGNLNGESILVHYTGGALIMREYNNSSLTEVGSGITISTGTQYYVTVTRTSLTGITLDVRTGSHTGTLVGSESGTITGSISLDTIQSGAYGRG